MLAARGRNALDAAVAAITDAGGGAAAVTVDVTDEGTGSPPPSAEALATLFEPGAYPGAADRARHT